MSTKEFTLSICIPTYNRASFLRTTIQSIVQQEIFQSTEEIEIVISDNNSTDSTEEICKEFAEIFPKKVFYYKNKENILDKNFEAALSRGRGKFLKLHNDTLITKNGSLAEIIRVIHATLSERPVIFLTNGENNTNTKQIHICNNIDDFVKVASFYSTWIGGFGIWKEDFNLISNFSLNSHLRLTQTDIIFRMISSGKRAIILSEKYFAPQNPGDKGGYNIAEVFGRNYLSLLKRYIQTKDLTEETFKKEKELLLKNHIIPFYFGENKFLKSGFFQHMEDFYNDDFFHTEVEKLITQKQIKIQEHSYNDNLSLLNYHWRLTNKHNDTNLLRIPGDINLSQITVGRRTYGGLRIFAFGNKEESLTIGHFCSIAADVSFILGGNHSYCGLSTFPFLAKYFDTIEAETKGPIVIEDDVWIGNGVTVLSGVCIGQGAVIAAGSVVSKDIPPYSIAGGNPAKVIKYRFEDRIIEKLKKLDFSKITDQTIFKNKKLISTALTPANIDEVIENLQNNSNSTK